MPTVADIAAFLEQFVPLTLAEAWDNVGLLVGDRAHPVARVMTCLTLTPESAAEAVARHADMVVTHHPLLFRPVQRITSDDLAGRMLLDLIGAEIAVYSPHTAFDSALGGINSQLAAGLGLQQIEPLVPAEEVALRADENAGAGRHGMLHPVIAFAELTARVKKFLSVEQLRVVTRESDEFSRVAVACGSGGSLLADAVRVGSDCLVTGETSFHTCLEAQASGVALILTGHYASERFALETLAAHLQQHLGVEVWASQRESNPLSDI